MKPFQFDYEKHSYSYVEIRKNDVSHGAYIHLHRALEALKQIPPGAKVLDFGCGAGALLRSIQHERPDLSYFGVDLSQLAINEAAASSTNISYSTIIDTLPYPDQYFDCILMFEVLEHVPNPDQTIQEVYRTLKPHGIYFLAVPQEKSLLTLQGWLLKLFHFKPSQPTAGHLWFWTESELKLILTTHKLMPLSKTYSQHFLWQIIGVAYMLYLLLTKRQTQELSKQLTSSKSSIAKVSFDFMRLLILFTNLEAMIFLHSPHGLDIQFICRKE